MRRIPWLTITRVFLAIVFATYGVVKLSGGQFFYGDWVMDKKTVGGPSLVWAFYGYSPWYGRFIGVAEFVPALLLLWRRTQLIGAMALFPVALNITAMDFSYGFPSVKWMALLYTALLGVLLWADRARLLLLLAAVPRTDVVASAQGTTRPVRRALLAVLVAFLVFVANLIATSLSVGPEVAAKAALVARGWPADRLQLQRSRYTGLFGVNRRAAVDFRVGGDSAPLVRVTARKATGFSAWEIEPVPDPNAR